MDGARAHSGGFPAGATETTKPPANPKRSAIVLLLSAAVVSSTSAQQPAKPRFLVFDSVTVIDVERGELVPQQRVVITGSRIEAVGDAGTVTIPNGAQVVDARGKYLIPGLWDMHTHAARSIDLFYPLFLANGVTGIRDAGSPVPLDTLRLWRQQILTGLRAGPPRQILSGQSIMDEDENCDRHRRQSEDRLQTCVVDADDARHVVDSLKAAGADMIKPRAVTAAMYFVVAAEARRLAIPFGGHVDNVTAMAASDSGASLIDHITSRLPNEAISALCWAATPSASVARCQPLAERLRSRGTWVVPTLFIYGGASGRRARRIAERFQSDGAAFWSDSARPEGWLRNAVSVGEALGTAADSSTSDSVGAMSIMERVGLPIVAGTDVMGAYLGETQSKALPGFSLHVELAMYAAEGLTPAEALRTATLNPAKLLHATDSLGTVAPGKLADLVLLDADPLADITNTTAIRAVTANGRYFDRAELDALLAQARAKVKDQP